jgi:hypothetical protein
VGWLVAIIAVPLLFTVLAMYTVMKVAFLLVRIAFAPVALTRR